MSNSKLAEEIPLSYKDFKEQVLADYRLLSLSRECSILGRREVLTGKAKFGIFGDGKELPQLILSKFFKNGDFRSGYYRDQTILMDQGHLSPKELFSALYAHPDIDLEPMSGGRQMGGHFVTRSIEENGSWKNLTNQKNHSSDISPTAGQMPRLVGLAQASKVYRSLNIKDSDKFSENGNEIAWGTIGNASTSEGLFLEAINAAGVMQIPMVISIWDDDYGISVHNDEQTTKGSISKALAGLQRNEEEQGFEILTVKGWDYTALIETYKYAEKLARNEHVPVLIHVEELTQPQGHSTSGSHQRYKSKERLEWEKQYDCNLKTREWILSNGFASEEELKAIEEDNKKKVRKAKTEAWDAYQAPILNNKKELILLIDKATKAANNDPNLQILKSELNKISEPSYKDILHSARKALRILTHYDHPIKEELRTWKNTLTEKLNPKFSSHLHSHSDKRLQNINPVDIEYPAEEELVDGRIIIRDNFDALLKSNDKVLIFGEDVGIIGDVNQGLEGMQAKYGATRVADTGIRETTIMGQGIGMALRGLRPIAEIQYLDYILYCLQTLSDDLASYHYRTVGKQAVPLIIRTRGHRLEGIWHSGSPMGGIVNLLRGINIAVPRNMTQAAGMYNTLLEGDEPAVVIESLNGYRLKERKPSNLGQFRVPLGKVETLKEGEDITLVSYGSTLRMVEAVAKELMLFDINAEVIDIQTLLPFDLDQNIKKSIAKTNRLLIIDEDVPGGASAYILQQLIEKQNVFPLLDSKPHTLSAKPHRPAYGSDGDYFSKPSEDDIFEKVYEIMHESDPKSYPKI
ncbi:thiamine pyrophosphate-dependent enzyme [Flavobacteriaceae bacterium]|uniref:alpha-ketoacid dehydrogenase subunit alpha/beta n=1 Tax=Candidatus Arcticimaribacter forsetii TaxID=2820661 RepID=UPI0020771339|nr:alpha-ketoacid dehydrogenase subunit alpha/beta [Candidatus Arcticimaribacter forsetii]MDB2345772.1 thiamine pyrophosphate-dependent enzyme [Flavobacteriaceae bacterium]MDB4620610.1 thiamine pyrophosphate-dependent enzyme [Flavobacteriaceae bacterium]MDB4674447.1 thiamine pyrophosphate-dependent enzyme [Flavobacteriaceae bacterium]MDB4717187.1 thiamine pyrophosphate-dependent enzyme [Flavobacteriaceae bacterium]MDB4751500.1 thiamine pyrophosphate-dependent enzyme [Flavobacteriaceae bacteriu